MCTIAQVPSGKLTMPVLGDQMDRACQRSRQLPSGYQHNGRRHLRELRACGRLGSAELRRRAERLVALGAGYVRFRTTAVAWGAMDARSPSIVSLASRSPSSTSPARPSQ